LVASGRYCIIHQYRRTGKTRSAVRKRTAEKKKVCFRVREAIAKKKRGGKKTGKSNTAKTILRCSNCLSARNLCQQRFVSTLTKKATNWKLRDGKIPEVLLKKQKEGKARESGGGETGRGLPQGPAAEVANY